MDISIICPIYNGEKYIEALYTDIRKQKGVNISEIKFILTDSKDKSEEILEKLNVEYTKISINNFSHSLVREKAAFEAKGDIVVFITQDIKICDTNWLYELVSSIEDGKCDAAFSRQIAYDNHTIEKYTREINYSKESRIVSEKDIEKLGLMTFFFSDASSAILKKTFIKLNGYDGKNLPTNEDMYFAYKLIMNGYKINYAADSIIIHSHEFSLKEVYKRYKDIGTFFAANDYLNEYSANDRGIDVFSYILKRILQDKKIYLFFEVFMNFFCRFIGMKVGKMKWREK